MCAWCWAFKNSWAALLERIQSAGDIEVRLVMGGLAPDSDELMSDEMREKLRTGWERIHALTATEFNMSYWDENVPRRSTYPACRASIAAGMQMENGVAKMFETIQRAHYLNAQNTSDTEVIAAVADEAGFDADQLVADLNSEPVHARLTSDFMIRDRFQVTGFPGVVVTTDTQAWVLTAGYCEEAELLGRWDRLRDEIASASGLAVK